MTTQTLRLALWGLVALAAAGTLWLWLGRAPTQAELLGSLGHGDYRLATTAGEPFTEATLQGAPSAVFFGFTHCPEVCPTTLGDIGAWQEALAAEGEGPLRVFFVTVDPERDTAETLRDYVSWVPDVTGVTGSREEAEAAIRAFRVYAQKVPLDDGDYTMDHSAMVLLFDKKGRFFAPIAYQEDLDRAMETIRRLMAS